MALYRLDEDVQQLLRKENFASDEFSVREFIEAMSKSQGHALADNELDPKPYIRTFEAVARELERLLDEATLEEDAALKRSHDLQETHNLSVLDIASNVNDGLSSIKHLDGQITEVSRATLQMSEHLNRLSQEHESVISLRTLVQYYLSFEQRGECPELLRLWNSEDPQDHRKCANIVGRLQLLAGKISAQETEDKINEFAESLERHLISLFQEAYAAFDLVGMREIAQVLHDFNQGSSAVQVFVSQHGFFMQVDRLEQDPILEDAGLWERLADPRGDHLEFEQLFSRIMDEVNDTVINETGVISRVFPRPTQVLSVFVQRVFAQYIQGKVLLYIQEAENRSLLAQARVLYVCYDKLSTMVKNFKESWQRHKVDPDGELAQVLDSNFADIFTMTVNDRYFAAVEVPLLQQILTAQFASYFRAHNLQPDRNSTPLPEEDEEGSAMDRFMRVMRTNTTSKSRRSSVPQTQESLIQMADVQVVLSACAETVGRLQVLRPGQESRHNAADLFNFLMQGVGLRYINVALDDAGAKAEQQDPRQPISWTFLDTVCRASNAVQLVAAFVKSVLFAMVKESDSEMADNINQYVSSCQDQCSFILESATSLYEARLRVIFGRQKKRDTVPRESDTNLDKPSEIASEVLALLEELHTAASGALYGTNFDSFLKSLTGGLYQELLEHLKRHQVNQLGARIIENDIAEYEQLVLNKWKVDAFDYFATLRALAKIFSAEASLLPSLLKDSRLARFKPSALREYVMLRPDYHSRNLNMLFLGYRTSYFY